jgi:CheY-like chemotaxis protein
MTGREPDRARNAAGSHLDPRSPLTDLVSAMLGRRVRDLRVEVREGGLVLRGRANSYHTKQLAQHAAMAVTDLPLAANEIEVTYLRRGVPVPDAEERGRSEAGPTRPRVLLAVGDDRSRSGGRAYLTARGYAVATATGGVECVALLDELSPDVLVLDADLLWGGANGVLAYLRARGDRPVPVVLLAARSAAPPGCGGLFAPPVVAMIERPVEMELLVRAVRSAAGGGAAAGPGA